MTDCIICCEKTFKNVICIFCEFESCTNCTRRYLMESNIDSHCMKCKKQWSRDFLDSVLPKTFINKELKMHRENILIDREKSLLPATQHLVEQTIHDRKYRKLIKDLNEKRRTLNNELQIIAINIRDAYTQFYVRDNAGVNEQEKQKFIRKCSAEDCMGYLSSQWKCGICNLWSCSDCHEIKGDTKEAKHTCNAENVESAKLITKDTHPCPSCATRIFKIDGCDQMFCTNCHTSFSWKTGEKVVSGVIHNPHYYEFMRNQKNGDMARQAGDVPCGGLPRLSYVIRLVQILNLKPKHSVVSSLHSIHRAISHIQHIEIQRFEFVMQNNDTNSDLRVKYMLKEITEQSWKSTLQKRDKKNEKNTEISQILQMFVDTASELFRTIIQGTCVKDVTTHLDTLESLRSYCNTSLEKISSRYSCVVPRIFEDWIISNIKK